MLNKANTKKLMLSIGVFLTGMLCVSIANVFGGYYCSATAISVILATFYVYGLFDNKIDIKNNLVNLVLVGVVVLFQLIFFVVNDIFNVPVYVKNYTSFWSVCVIISQIISICSIIYCLGMFVYCSRKNDIEIVENIKQESVENSVSVEVNADDNFVSEEENKEIKTIAERNFDKSTPYMEEEN